MLKVQLLILFFFPLFLLAQGVLDEPIDFSVKDELIIDAIFSLSEEADINITFSPKIFDKQSRVSINEKKQPLDFVLKKCLNGTEIVFKNTENGILLYKKSPVFFTLNGYLSDAKTGERLIGANIIEIENASGSASNSYGFYSKKFKQGKVKLQVSYLGYKTAIIEIDLNKSQRLDVALEPSLTLEEVVVIARKDSLVVGLIRNQNALPFSRISQLPTAGGEADIIRYIQLLPGIESGADGFGGLHVRGGNSDQNLILLDDVAVYNPSHTFGLFSIFNPDLAKSVKLYKSGFPAQYSGRISSVLDVRTKEGNTENFTAEASIGAMAVRGIVEIPLWKSKGSILIAGRRAYTNTWLNDLSQAKKAVDNNEGVMSYDFHDINLKAHYSIGLRDKIYGSYYSGSDVFYDYTQTIPQEISNTQIGSEAPISGFRIKRTTRNDYNLEWGNKIASLRWNHLYNDKLFSNTTFTYSRFNYKSHSENSLKVTLGNLPLGSRYYGTRHNSTIEDNSVRTDFDYFLNNNHHLKFGGGLTLRDFIPGLTYIEEIEQSSIDSLLEFSDFENFEEELQSGGQDIEANEYNIYLEDQAKFGKWSIHTGIHLASFSVKEHKTVAPQPRISSQYEFSKKLSMQASITRTTQFLHLLTNTDSGLPSDLWVPSSENIKPQNAWQFSGGIQGRLKKEWSWNVEAYYKKMDNLLRFDSDFFEANDSLSINAENWEPAVEVGSGKTYGIEAILEKNKGRLTGWLSYTYAESYRYFNQEKIADRYDSRHGITVAASYKINDWMNFSANWFFKSGLPLYSSKAYTREIPFSSILNISTLDSDAERLPAYHRLDANVNINFGKKRFKHKLNLGIYNIYNQKNVFFAYHETIGSKKTTSAVNSLPILPSIGYSVLFE